MNGNDDKELTGEDALRAKLCAVILGESSETERAEVEAALANSAELRAERTRLEATIGMVSTALKQDGGAVNELSAEAQTALSDAVARRARPIPWHRTSSFRIAASFVLFAGVVSIWRASMLTTAPRGSESRLVDGLVASAPDKEREVDRDSAQKAGEPKAAAPELADSKSLRGVDLLDDATEASNEQPPATALHFGVDPQDGNALGKIELAKKPGEITGNDFLKLDSSVAQGSDAGVAKDQLVRRLEEAREQQNLAQSEGEVHRFSSVVTPLGGSLTPSPFPDPAAAAPSTPGSQPTGAVGGTPIGVSRAAGLGLGAAGGSGAPTAGKRGEGAHTERSRSAAPGEKAAEVNAGIPNNPAPPGPATGGAAPAKSEGKAKDGGEVRKGLAANGYVGGDDQDKSRLDGFEVPLYRSDKGGVPASGMFADDWRSRFEQMQRTCWPRPNEKPRDMFFRYWGDNPFEITAFDKLSTFSVDVDTASYTVARNLLVNGSLPPKEAVRTEEFVNYFKGDVPPPREGTFNVATEFAPNMFGDSADSWMLRVALRGREVQKNERMPLTLTFIIDVSGSMRENERLELVKHALRLLVSQLDARDSISLVKFSTDASLVLPMTSARQRDLIESAINPLQPEGSTNTEAGLRMGYAQAVAALSQGSNNRVVLLTDGVANVGITDPNALTAMVESQRKAGIYLNTVGVGMNNHNDNLLEQLADKGDGLCNYVDDEKEVRRALVDNFTGAFETIARDVKIQVEFDPTQVERYRLLGYENRAVADADFRNDKVDAGEVGAGHQVIALYEIVRTHVSGDGPLATVHVRWKAPYKNGVKDSESDTATEIAQPVYSKSAAGSFIATSPGYRRAVLVAQFAEFLRRSIHARSRRLPIGVSVASIARNSVTSAPAPANIGSTNSRLRTVTASSTRHCCRS